MIDVGEENRREQSERLEDVGLEDGNMGVIEHDVDEVFQADGECDDKQDLDR